MTDVIRDGRQEPMLPGRTLAQRATARPWHTIGGGHTIEDAAGQVVICGSWNEYGCGYLPNTAFIVYAVNHIEQAEADLQEALRLLGAVLYPSRVKEQGYGAYAEAKAAAGRLLARHAPQEDSEHE